MRSFAAFLLVGLALQASVCLANSGDRKSAPHRLLLLSGAVDLPTHRGVDGGWTDAEIALSSTADVPIQHYYIHFDVDAAEPHKIASEIDRIVQTRSKEARARYLPHNTFLVSATSAELSAIQQLPNVLWTGRMWPHHKFHQSVYSQDTDSLTSPLRSVAERVARLFSASPALKSTAPVQISSCTYADMQRAKSGWKRMRVALGDFASQSTADELLQSWRSSHADQQDSLVLCHTTHRLVSFWLIKQSDVPAAVTFFSSHAAVRWIEPVHSGEFHNAVAQWVTQTGQRENRRYTDAGILGHNQLVAVADTGLDSTHCFFYDPAVDLTAHMCQQCNYSVFQTNSSYVCPFSTLECSKPSNHRKIAAYWALADRGDQSYGHGTHVCGTVAGAVNGGSSVMGKYNGTGQGAKLVFTDLSSPQYSFAVPPHPSSQLFPFGYSMGARIFTNSWGHSSNGYAYYNYDAQDIDVFLRAHDDSIMLFSAANDGQQGPNSVSFQGQSKNSLVVGAGGTDQSHMPDIVAADAVKTWNQIIAQACNPAVYLMPNGPCQMLQLAGSTIPCDHMYSYYCPKVQSFSYCCSMRHGNGNDTALAALMAELDIDCCESTLATLDANPDAYITRVAFFSSRGPTYDYRIKPDIIAPGYSLLSSRAGDPANPAFHCSSDPDSSSYSLLADAGTSMASPAAAGAIAVLREYLTKSWSDVPPIPTLPLNNPSGALMKAFVIHSAVPIYDEYRENVTVDKMFHPVTPWLTRNLSANNPNDTYIMGFGRIQLSNVMRLPGDLLHVGFVDGSCEFLPLLNGQSFNLTINLVAGKFDPKRLLKVSLVWTDPAAETFSSVALVNDLDLIVTTPSGQQVFGNTQYNLYQGGKDSLNNVEQVWFTAPQAGVYTATVRGTHIPLPPYPSGQDYAIVYSYGLPAVYIWQPGTWGACSAISGIGIQNRSVTCVTADGAAAPSSFCHDSPPTTTQPCCVVCPDPTAISQITCSSSFIGSSQHVESVCSLNATLVQGMPLSLVDVTRFHLMVLDQTTGAAVSVNVDGPALSADKSAVTWTLHRNELPAFIPKNGWVQLRAHYNLQNGQLLLSPGSAQILSAVAPDGANITCGTTAIDPGFSFPCTLTPTYQGSTVYSMPSDLSLQTSDASVYTSALVPDMIGFTAPLSFQVDVSEHAFGRIFVTPLDGTGSPFSTNPTPFGFNVHLHPTAIGPVVCSSSYVGGFGALNSVCSVNLTFAAGTVASLEIANLHLNLANLTTHAATGVAVSSGPTIRNVASNTVSWTIRQSGTAAYGFAQLSVVFTPEAGNPVVASAPFDVLSADTPDGAEVSCGPATFTSGSSTLCFVVPYKGSASTYAAPSDLAVKSSNAKVTLSDLEFDSITASSTPALAFSATADASFSGAVTITPMRFGFIPLGGTVQTATVTVDSPPDSSDDGKKKGIIAGAVIGSLVVVAAIIVFSVWAYMNKRFCFEERPRAQSYFVASEPEYDTEYRQL